jgi:hypothetical protein
MTATSSSSRSPAAGGPGSAGPGAAGAPAVPAAAASLLGKTQHGGVSRGFALALAEGDAETDAAAASLLVAGTTEKVV